MKAFIAKNWPLVAAILLFWLMIGLLLSQSIKQNEGHFVYLLDDAYIHMAIAKNFALHGVWGITRYEFSSTSSSPLWTLLLTGLYLVFGVNEITSFILNLLFTTLILVVTHILLRKRQLQPDFIFLTLLGMIFLIPLPSMVFTGLEHSLHILITMLFATSAAQVIVTKKSTLKDKSALWLFFLAPLVPFVRYEGIALLLLTAILLILYRHIRHALFLLLLGLAPITLFGLISVAQGWFWLPNSVLLKGGAHDLSSLKGLVDFLGYRGYYQIVKIPSILLLFIVNLMLYFAGRKQQKPWTSAQILLLSSLLITFLHLHFAAGDAQFNRYIGYLMGLGLLAFALALAEHLPKDQTIFANLRDLVVKHTLLAIFPLFFLPFVCILNTQRMLDIPRGTTNIYEQHYQEALFLKTFYPGVIVAANDIGAINFLTDIRCIDLVGLGTLETAKKILKNEYQGKAILAAAKDAKIAIIYDSWLEHFGKDYQAVWHKAGSWTIPKNVVAGGNQVSFYAIDPAAEATLIQNLKAFAKKLPAEVTQTGKYVE